MAGNGNVMSMYRIIFVSPRAYMLTGCLCLGKHGEGKVSYITIGNVKFVLSSMQVVPPLRVAPK